MPATTGDDMDVLLLRLCLDLRDLLGFNGYELIQLCLYCHDKDPCR